MSMTLLSRVGQKTAAILPVHMFGLRMDVSRLVATGVPVIEDAAQTLVPGIADQSACATLSFFPTKNLGAAGDGGAVVTAERRSWPKSCRRCVNMARSPSTFTTCGAATFRLDPLQAAILRIKLRHLDEWQALRRRNAARIGSDSRDCR
jgi:dTDP-4-amino-4,6-dideoxygalactose transaminase